MIVAVDGNLHGIMFSTQTIKQKIIKKYLLCVIQLVGYTRTKLFFQNEKVQCSHISVYKQFEGSINNRFIKLFWFSWLTSKIKKYLLLWVKGSRVKLFQIFSLTVNKMSFYAKCTPRLGTFSSRQIYNNNKSKKENIMISCVQINCTRKRTCV